jgi:hypothetical protein
VKISERKVLPRVSDFTMLSSLSQGAYRKRCFSKRESKKKVCNKLLDSETKEWFISGLSHCIKQGTDFESETIFEN